MTIQITVNGNLTLDQTAGLQTPATTDTGNDVDVTYGGNVADPLGGLHADFLTYLNGLGLSDAQKEFAALVDGASSGASFISVAATAGEEVDDLFFSDSNGDPLNGDLVAGMETLAGDPLYLWSVGDGDIVIVTTSNVSAASGRIVAAFFLNEAGDHLSAQVQMVTFEPIGHTDQSDPDDTLDFTDVLQVSASGSLSFDFDELESGNFLYAAIGTTAGGLLVTGNDLNVNDNTGSKFGNIVNGGSDPSDSVNTSQGGIGATIGVNAQHFVAGETAVFTLVTGFVPLAGGTGEATGIDIEDIDYSGYINTNGASLFISQVSGGNADFTVSLFSAGGGTTPEEGFGYIGDQDTDSALHDDAEVDVLTVTITRGASSFVWNSGNSGATQSGITVTISGNDFTVLNAQTSDTVAWTSDGDFNRFKVDGLAGTDAFDIGRVDIDKGVTVSEGLGADLLADDDGPAIGDSAGGTAIANSTVQFTTGATSGNVALGDLPGTDGQSSLQITNFTSSVTILGKTIEGQINGAGTEVKYFEDTNNNNVLDAGETHWYTLSITQNASGGDFYKFDVINAPAAPPLEFNFAGLPSGQNLFGMVASAGAPDGPGIVFFGGDTQIKANGTYTNTSDTINTSQGGGPTTIGNSNQMVDAGEGIYFVICNDPGGLNNTFLANVAGGLNQNEADDADNMQFASLREVSAAFVRISQTQGNEVEAASFEAFDITNNSTNGRALLTAGKDHVDIVKVNVWLGSVGGTLLETTNAAGGDGGMSAITVTIDSDGVAHVSGLEAGYLVEWITDDPSTVAVEKHDEVLITGTAGKFDIGGFGTSEPQVTPDHPLSFQVTLKDGDLDSAVDTFSVTVDAFPFIV